MIHTWFGVLFECAACLHDARCCVRLTCECIDSIAMGVTASCICLCTMDLDPHLCAKSVHDLTHHPSNSCMHIHRHQKRGKDCDQGEKVGKEGKTQGKEGKLQGEERSIKSCRRARRCTQKSRQLMPVTLYTGSPCVLHSVDLHEVACNANQAMSSIRIFQFWMRRRRVGATRFEKNRRRGTLLRRYRNSESEQIETHLGFWPSFLVAQFPTCLLDL